jgi:hypothetical protein
MLMSIGKPVTSTEAVALRLYGIVKEIDGLLLVQLPHRIANLSWAQV